MTAVHYSSADTDWPPFDWWPVIWFAVGLVILGLLFGN